MAQRSDKMARISANMAPVTSSSATTSPTTTVTDPLNFTPITDETPKTVDKKAEKTAEKQALAQKKAADDALAEREQHRENAVAGGSATLASVQKIWRGTQARLSDLPMPGSLMFPLAILLLGFFILIPVNGHSRLTWLWLTLSANAKIGLSTFNAAQDAAPSGQGITKRETVDTSGPDIVPTVTGNPSSVLLPTGGGSLAPFNPGLVFSGVRDDFL